VFLQTNVVYELEFPTLYLLKKLQEMKEAIIQETRLQDHESYKMFFLVLMSHGRKDKIGGCDGPDDEVSMDDLLNLISPKNFPAMTGKPKVVIIQSCSGGMFYLFLG